MTKRKTTTRKPAALPKPSKEQFLRVLDGIQQSIGKTLARVEGMHGARAELLRPTLEAIQRCADTQGKALPRNVPTDEVLLQPADCLLLLKCLAEGGYTLNAPAKREWSMVAAGDDAMHASLRPTATEAAKAA